MVLSLSVTFSVITKVMRGCLSTGAASWTLNDFQFCKLKTSSFYYIIMRMLTLGFYHNISSFDGLCHCSTKSKFTATGEHLLSFYTLNHDLFFPVVFPSEKITLEDFHSSSLLFYTGYDLSPIDIALLIFQHYLFVHESHFVLL